MKVNLPSPPLNTPSILASFLRSICSTLELHLNKLFEPKARNWRPQNVPIASLQSLREFDADTADLDTLRKAMALLVKELTDSGLIANG